MTGTNRRDDVAEYERLAEWASGRRVLAQSARDYVATVAEMLVDGGHDQDRVYRLRILENAVADMKKAQRALDTVLAELDAVRARLSAPRPEESSPPSCAGDSQDVGDRGPRPPDPTQLGSAAGDTRDESYPGCRR